MIKSTNYPTIIQFPSRKPLTVMTMYCKIISCHHWYHYIIFSLHHTAQRVRLEIQKAMKNMITQ